MIDFKYSGFVGMSVAMLMLAACSGDDTLTTDEQKVVDRDASYVKFNFSTQILGNGMSAKKITRENDENYKEDTNVLEGESDINNVRIFYFPVKESNDFSGPFNEMTISYSSDGSVYYPIPYTSDDSYVKGRYHFYALINNTDFKAWDGMTEKDFRDAVVTYTTPTYFDFANRKITSNGLPMASRRNDDNQVSIYTVANDYDRLYVDANLMSGADSAQIGFSVERQVAKVVYECTKDNNSYPVTIEEGETTYHLADVKLNSARICGMRNSSYLFRHVGTFESSDGMTGTLSNIGFGALNIYDSSDYYSTTGYFVLDPTFEDKYSNPDNVTFYSGTKYSELNENAQYSSLTSTLNGQCVIDYPLENTMPRQMQQQHLSTGIVFSSSLTPDADRYYVTSNGSAVNGSYTAGSDLYYCDGYFADSQSTLALIPALKNTGEELSSKTTVFNGGVCYYVYWIREITANDAVKMNNMEFCIVRNTAYYVGVNNIKGLGASTPEGTIKKGDPDKGRNLLIDVSIQVSPWNKNEQGSVDIYSAKAKN